MTHRVVRYWQSAAGMMLLTVAGLLEAATWEARTIPNPVTGGVVNLAEVEVRDVKVSVRCDTPGGLTSVRFFLDSGVVKATGESIWQFDSQPPEVGRWIRSANWASLVVPVAIQERFIRRLKAYRTLLITLRDGRGGDFSAVIPLQGSSEVISKALRDC